MHTGDRWLWDLLPDNDDQVEYVISPNLRPVARMPGSRTRFGKGLNLAMQAAQLARTKDFDLIVAWESKNGLPLTALRWLRQTSCPPLVILTFSAKPYLHTLQPLLRGWWRQVDHFTTPSAWEARYYSARFGLPSDRVSVCLLGSPDVLGHIAAMGSGSISVAPEPYVFTGGRTGRDHETFLAAAAGLDMQAVLYAPITSLDKMKLPANVRLQPLMPRDAYYSTLAGAAIVVLPLRSTNHAAGLSLLLPAMSAGRPIICSDTPVIREYVRDGETALLVPPNDAVALRNTVARLMADDNLRQSLGRHARQHWQEQHTQVAFAAKVDQILTAVVEGRTPSTA